MKDSTWLSLISISWNQNKVLLRDWVLANTNTIRHFHSETCGNIGTSITSAERSFMILQFCSLQLQTELKDRVLEEFNKWKGDIQFNSKNILIKWKSRKQKKPTPNWTESAQSTHFTPILDPIFSFIKKISCYLNGCEMCMECVWIRRANPLALLLSLLSFSFAFCANVREMCAKGRKKAIDTGVQNMSLGGIITIWTLVSIR